MTATVSCLDPVQVAPEAITVDPEFAAYIPPPSRGERANLERAILKDGCLVPLIVWQWQGLLILLDGHHRLQMCRKHNIAFYIGIRLFTDRAAALRYVIDVAGDHRNLSAESAAYLRGAEYLAEKAPRGGRREGTRANSQNGRLETAQRLADKHKVSRNTIYRDAELKLAVDEIAENCGPKAKHAILSRDTGLRRGAIMRISEESPDVQRQAIADLLQHGKLPRRKPSREPLDIEVYAARFFDKYGKANSLALSAALTKIVEQH